MASSTRRRASGGPGPGQWVALGGAVLVILGLTFALGLLVGRQWTRHLASAAAPSVSEAARKAATSPRRGGITAEVMADRAPEPTEKLTFYQTLTEPLNEPAARPKPGPKPVAVRVPLAPRPAPAVPPEAPPSLPPLPPREAETTESKAAKAKSADGGSAGAISGPPQMNNAVASALPASPNAQPGAPHAAPPPQASAPRANGSPPPWTIQVAAYKNRRQAEETRQQLAASGLDAYVARVAAQEGQARFRVRVGTYRTREEAAAAADRLRARRSLTTFVTLK